MHDPLAAMASGGREDLAVPRDPCVLDRGAEEYWPSPQ
jgi:hypothetical protein